MRSANKQRSEAKNGAGRRVMDKVRPGEIDLFVSIFGSLHFSSHNVGFSSKLSFLCGMRREMVFSPSVCFLSVCLTERLQHAPIDKFDRVSFGSFRIKTDAPRSFTGIPTDNGQQKSRRMPFLSIASLIVSLHQYLFHLEIAQMKQREHLLLKQNSDCST